MTPDEAYEKLRAEHNCGDPNCAGLPDLSKIPKPVPRAIEIDSSLAEAIRYWNGFGVPVRWHIFTEGNQAIGIGEGFLWSIEVDADGTVHTHEVNNVTLEWETGIAI